MTEALKQPTEGRRARRLRETRSALLDAAMVLLRERGIYGTHVEDITDRADVGKGVFYNYFESKEALVAHLVSEGVELLERDYFCKLADERTINGRIEALTRGQEAFFSDHPELAMVFHQGRGLLLLEGDRAVHLRAAFTDYLHRLSHYIPAQESPATWRSDDLLDVAAAIVGASAGYRSFCIAVGRPIRVPTISTALIAGIPRVLEERRRKPSGTASQGKGARKRT